MLIWLKQIRITHNITQEKVAAEIGITVRYYQYIESGKYKPSVKVAKKIAELLNFEWEKFYQEENK